MTALRPKQSLGQNFLVDDNIARNIVREFHPSETDIVVEIGPGQGALTKHLDGNVGHLIAVEIDSRAVQQLQQQFSHDRVTIIHQDFLELPLTEWSQKFNKRLRLIGNLPYHITSPVLFKAFENNASVADLTIMIQREVAHRIVAKPNTKEYGILSVFSQFYGTPKCLFDVSANCFFPKPNVTSTVLHLHIHELVTTPDDDRLFRLVVKTVFGKRRKTIRNGLRYLPYDENLIDQILQNVRSPLTVRPEEMAITDFLRLTDEIKNILIQCRQ
jgi:16S rRNA (adenine1518-N6/adenine1519-N6)-dimethyltransferase